MVRNSLVHPGTRGNHQPEYTTMRSSTHAGSGNDEPVLFDTVFEEELKEIEERRKEDGNTEESIDGAPSASQEQPRENLVGLAFSGGGIRSATFCLGMLQSLSRHGLLRAFDYLSTVSGGGYAGG